MSENQKRFVADDNISVIEAYQGKGYGKLAMQPALASMKTYPCGNVEYCWNSYEVENIISEKQYHSFGFVGMGDIDGKEKMKL